MFAPKIKEKNIYDIFLLSHALDSFFLLLEKMNQAEKVKGDQLFYKAHKKIGQIALAD